MNLEKTVKRIAGVEPELTKFFCRGNVMPFG
jgi:hypothetical protein